MQNFILTSLEQTGLSLTQTRKTGFFRDGLNVSYHLFKPEDPV